MGPISIIWCPKKSPTGPFKFKKWSKIVLKVRSLTKVKIELWLQRELDPEGCEGITINRFGYLVRGQLPERVLEGVP